MQRYAWTWTGDIETSWKGLRQTIPTVLNLGLSGITYSGGDGYGESRLDNFYLTQNQDCLELTWKQQGSYAFPYASVKLHLHGFEPQQVWVDGNEVVNQGMIINICLFLN